MAGDGNFAPDQQIDRPEVVLPDHVAINIPFIILGYRQIGKGFAIKTGIAITLFWLECFWSRL